MNKSLLFILELVLAFVLNCTIQLQLIFPELNRVVPVIIASGSFLYGFGFFLNIAALAWSSGMACYLLSRCVVVSMFRSRKRSRRK